MLHYIGVQQSVGLDFGTLDKQQGPKQGRKIPFNLIRFLILFHCCTWLAGYWVHCSRESKDRFTVLCWKMDEMHSPIIQRMTFLCWNWNFYEWMRTRSLFI